MTKSALTILAVTSTLVLGGMGCANAATITETYDFTASGLTPSGISPVDPWTGSFTITFNTTLSGTVGPLALDAFSSNLPASYGTFMYSQGGNFVTVGDDCNAFGGCGVTSGNDQAFLNFSVDPSGVPSPIGAAIANTSNTGLFASTTDVTMTLAAPTVPLPATLPLFATGLGALGLLGWFRKRKARVSLLGAA